MEYDPSQSEPMPEDANAAGAVPQLLKLQKAGMGRLAVANRLREGDILVAIDGELFLGDTEALTSAFEDYDPTEPDIPWLLTFWRDDVFFNICFAKPLKAKYDLATPEEALNVMEGFQKLTFGPIDRYQNYEVFKDLQRNAALHPTTEDPLATYIPLFWMLNNRIYYPMVAIFIVYAATFVAHPLLFVVGYVLTCVYVKRAQLNLLRSYHLFEDKFYWFVMAGKTESEVKTICRQIDPKIRFAFDKDQQPRRLNRLERRELREREAEATK